MIRIGVLLAAGRGRRMGRTKQLVLCQTPGGNKPLVAAAYDAIRPICDDMVVVLGHDADIVAAALGDREFIRVQSDPDAPMYESIRIGLRASMGLNAEAAVVLHPGDHPIVAKSTLTTLTDCSVQRPKQAIVPTYLGKGGHPILIPPAMVGKLIDVESPDGLGAYWLAHPELCHRVAVEDPGVVRDIDEPGDLSAGTAVPLR